MEGTRTDEYWQYPRRRNLRQARKEQEKEQQQREEGRGTSVHPFLLHDAAKHVW